MRSRILTVEPCCCDSGAPEEALASLDQAIVANSGYAEAYLNRGSVLKELHRFDEALASYGKAIQIAPGFALAYLRRGCCWPI